MPLRRGLVAHDQRDAGIAQGVEANGNRELGDAVEGGAAVGGNAEFIFQIEGASAACQLDDIGDVVDGLEGWSAVVALDQAGDVLVEHGLAQARGDEIDELIAAQNAGEIGVVENVVGSGQAQGSAGDDDGNIVRGRVLAAMDLPAALENLGKEVAEFGVVIGSSVGDVPSGAEALIEAEEGPIAALEALRHPNAGSARLRSCRRNGCWFLG